MRNDRVTRGNVVKCEQTDGHPDSTFVLDQHYVQTNNVCGFMRLLAVFYTYLAVSRRTTSAKIMRFSPGLLCAHMYSKSLKISGRAEYRLRNPERKPYHTTTRLKKGPLGKIYRMRYKGGSHNKRGP